MLQFKLDTLDGLDEVTRAYYRASGDKFILDLDPCGNETVTLKTRMENLLSERSTLKQQLKAPPPDAAPAVEAQRAAAAELETVRAEVERRVADAGRDADARGRATVDKQLATIRRLKVDTAAREIATRLASKGSEQLLMPHIAARLDVVERDGEFVVTAKTRNGGDTTLAGVESEFREDPAFAPVIRGASDADKLAHARLVDEMLGRKSTVH